LLAQGRLDLWVLELDGKVAAAQFGFRYGDRLFQLQEGNDPAHASDRVGFLLRGHVMKELIAQGVRTYDFLGGELGYKAHWGAQAGYYLDLQFARPFSAGAAYLRAQLYAGHSKSWLRRNLPESAWQLLHRAKVNLRGEQR
jgi:CelD/BcsL family acetyltransferase involved in cellulose biosynthesis